MKGDRYYYKKKAREAEIYAWCFFAIAVIVSFLTIWNAEKKGDLLEKEQLKVKALEEAITICREGGEL